jgi:protein ImuB
MPLTAPSSLNVPAGVEPNGPANERPQPLWFALVFPSLALEACGLDACSICAVTHETRHGQRIYQVSAAARRRGIEVQMGLTAALALCPGLVHAPRDEASEKRHLRSLLNWSKGFTPTVSQAPPDALLLEVRASLRLFHGAAALHQRLGRELERQGYHHHIAGAPTAQASLLLGRSGQALLIEQPDGLRSALGDLPIDRLDLDPRLLWRLHRTGLRSLRDLWRLPRDGISRRFGHGLQHYLDRLLGKHPDPRATVPRPRCFSATQELPAPAVDSTRVLAAVRRLLTQLVGYLRQCDGAVSSLRLELAYTRNRASSMTVCTRDATRDAEHLLRLCTERLRSLQLPAPVEKVCMVCADILPHTPPDQHLFERAHCQESWQQRLEEIEARLGPDCLWQPGLCSDHRPEQAWAELAQPWSAKELPAAKRPLWLLARPQQLVCRQGQPWHRGLLALCDGPERIETGWWDGGGCRRDYYVACNEQGEQLWVFQDLQRCGTWYLHGLFA